MTNQTDKQIEDLAKIAIFKISSSKEKTAFILRKKMDAAATAERLSGIKIIESENVKFFWNLVGASLSYVKPTTLIY